MIMTLSAHVATNVTRTHMVPVPVTRAGYPYPCSSIERMDEALRVVVPESRMVARACWAIIELNGHVDTESRGQKI